MNIFYSDLFVLYLSQEEKVEKVEEKEREMRSFLLGRRAARLGTSPNSSRKPSADTTCLRPPRSRLKHTQLNSTHSWTDTPPLITHTPMVTHTPVQNQSRTAAVLTPTTRPRQSTRNTTARKTAVPWRRLPRKPAGMERQTTGTAGQTGSGG